MSVNLLEDVIFFHSALSIENEGHELLKYVGVNGGSFSYNGYSSFLERFGPDKEISEWNGNIYGFEEYKEVISVKNYLKALKEALGE